MYLVKSIVQALQSSKDSQMSESEIKSVVGKAKRDYGTTNNTLRRLCDHKVLSRHVGLSKRNRPSWLYRLEMTDSTVAKYIVDKEAKIAAYIAQKQNPAFEFGEEHLLNTAGFSTQPLIIGMGLAPLRLEEKCLIVSPSYNMHITKNHEGYDVLHFTRKTFNHAHKR